MALFGLDRRRGFFWRSEQIQSPTSAEVGDELPLTSAELLGKNQVRVASAAAYVGRVRGLLDRTSGSDSFRQSAADLLSRLLASPGDHDLWYGAQALEDGLRRTEAREAAEAAGGGTPNTPTSGELYQAALTYNIVVNRDPDAVASLELVFGAQALADQVKALSSRAPSQDLST